MENRYRIYSAALLPSGNIIYTTCNNLKTWYQYFERFNHRQPTPGTQTKCPSGMRQSNHRPPKGDPKRWVRPKSHFTNHLNSYLFSGSPLFGSPPFGGTAGRLPYAELGPPDRARCGPRRRPSAPRAARASAEVALPRRSPHSAAKKHLPM